MSRLHDLQRSAWSHRSAVCFFAAALAMGLWVSSGSIYPTVVRASSHQSASNDNNRYEIRAHHDPNGTGRFYMGREIAQVMGAAGISWLDRPERDEEERPEVVIEALNLHPGSVVADLGAGSGYFALRIAKKVGETGKVFAVDIQDEMLEILRQRASKNGLTNINPIKATETDPNLPTGVIDAVLLVDVYHELYYPYEVMSHVRDSLRADGHVVFVEYRKEDPAVSIKEVHKMSVAQLTREMSAVGLTRISTIEKLPSQHIVIFGIKAVQGGD